MSNRSSLNRAHGGVAHSATMEHHLARRRLDTLRVALLLVLFIAAAQPSLAGPPYRILNHEAIRIDWQTLSRGHQHLSLTAFGKQFELSLQPNEGIRRAVPAGRSDIQPLQGSLDGQPDSWVRITRTRAGWHGMLFDGQELYAIEPVADIAEALVQPHPTSATEHVMYRLADALMTVGSGFCATSDADGTSGSDSSTPDRPSAMKVFKAVAADLNGQTSYPSKRLMVGVVADNEFATAFDDPEGAIIARMDIVDGIFSSQVGVKISLAPLTVITSASEPFTATAPSDLLNQLRQYRGSSPSQMSLGVTHLMTGRNLDGDIVGIAFEGTICSGDTSAGLSEGWHSTTMSALIAAHELGHNFNAVHDGVPGACVSTPQTYLMSPTINGSNQFSSCSLQQIQARIQTAQCLTAYVPPDVVVGGLPDAALGVGVNSPFTVSYTVSAMGDDPSNSVSTTVSLPSNITVQSATTTGTGGACTEGTGTVSCSLGTLTPGETREIELQLTATATGTATISFAVTSSNDSDPTNDSRTLAANISEAPPPVAAATQTTSGSGDTAGASGNGGGGGGRIDLVALAFLSLSLGLAARARLGLRRPPALVGRRRLVLTERRR